MSNLEQLSKAGLIARIHWLEVKTALGPKAQVCLDEAAASALR